MADRAAMGPARGRFPVWSMVVCALVAACGCTAFLFGILGAEPLRAWQIYLVNFVFWTGTAFAGVLFVAVLNMTNAEWGRPIKRLAESLSAFAPVSFLLYWVIFAGREHLLFWLTNPKPEKSFWLNEVFFFGRDAIALVVMAVLALAMMYYSVRSDRQWIREGHGGEGWRRDWRAQAVLSPVYAIAYSFGLTVLGLDLIMCLDSEWYSSLFGAYYFTSAFFIAVAALYLFMSLSYGFFGLGRIMGDREFHDMGKLALAFTMFTGYLFYVQVLTIWYGNLPAESRFIIKRMRLEPWEPVAWVVVSMAFFIPFFLLLSRRIKVHRTAAIGLSLCILVGMWIERFLLVIPSTWKRGDIPFGSLEVLVSAGFLGLVILCVGIYLRLVPLFPVSDPLFRKFVEEAKSKLEP